MHEARSESGFSLVELLVAMLVTMIVSGAVFALINAGQGAFRREPELTDRQQNIRLAMDLIQRDIATAGAGMHPFEQAFSRGDGANEGGQPLDGLSGVLGAPDGPSGFPPDVLEVKGADGSCNDVPAGLPAGTQLATVVNLPICFPGVPPPVGPPTMGLVAISFGPGGDTAAWGMTGPNGGTLVQFGAQPVKSELPGGNIPAGTPLRVIPIQIARYAIIPDAAQVPSLWRSGRGGLDAAGGLTLPGDPAGEWQLIARGIEDLQVRYRHAGDAAPGLNSPRWHDPAADAFTNIVQEVEVTLWARTFAPNLQGQTIGPLGNMPAAVRGSLVTVTTPRAALAALSTPAAGGLQWR